MRLNFATSQAILVEPYRGWVARCKTSSSRVANLALAHLRLPVGAAAQVAEARTGFLDAQDER